MGESLMIRALEVENQELRKANKKMQDEINRARYYKSLAAMYGQIINRLQNVLKRYRRRCKNYYWGKKETAKTEAERYYAYCLELERDGFAFSSFSPREFRIHDNLERHQAAFPGGVDA